MVPVQQTELCFGKEKGKIVCLDLGRLLFVSSYGAVAVSLRTYVRMEVVVLLSNMRGREFVF